MGSRWQLRLQGVCLGANFAWVNACLRQFAGVADQPALDLARICFQMALQPQHVLVKRKRLIGANVCPGQAQCAGRNVELIAMPVQYRHIAQCAQW